MVRHLLSVTDIEDEFETLVDRAIDMKMRFKKGEGTKPLADKTLGMLFEKSSTRTRISFETGMTQLGGHAIFLGKGDVHLGEKETIADTARVLSRYVDAVMYRAMSGKDVRELARHSTVPVINALDDIEHPCQIAADFQTVKEHKGRLEGLKLAYIGDGNNVCNSLILGAAITGMDISVACPSGYDPNAEIIANAMDRAKATGSKIRVVREPKEAAHDADVLYTDVWVSMGDTDKEKRKRVFKPYQINDELLAAADHKAIVMHCLPAMRGQEITDSVIDGKQSVVFDQAENRLHAQKAILIYLINDEMP